MTVNIWTIFFFCKSNRNSILFSLSTCLCILITRVILILLRHKKTTEKNKKEKLRVVIVLGSGGHTSEMLAILRRFPSLKPWKISFLTDELDQHSRDRVNAVPYLRDNTDQILFPRCRRVGDRFFNIIAPTIKSCLKSVGILAHHQPDLILCNGPGTCVPLCLMTRILEVFFFIKCPTRIVYIESVCRVRSLSLTGQILYFIADRCFVQWKELQQKYPKTVFCGILS